MPGLVSTLLNQAYSMPSRLVHTFLQVTEQVWQPMHLSRFSTIAICARTFIVLVPQRAMESKSRRARERSSPSPCGRGLGGGVRVLAAYFDPSPYPPPTRGGGRRDPLPSFRGHRDFAWAFH